MKARAPFFGFFPGFDSRDMLIGLSVNISEPQQTQTRREG